MGPLLMYATGLAAATFIAALTVRKFPNGQLVRCAAALAVNWLFGVAFGLLTGITDGWWFNILIDSAAAFVILWRPAGKWQAALGVTYCAQIAMHIGYGFLSLRQANDPMPYYDWLTWVAWAQLLILGGWCGGIWLRHSRRRGARLANADREINPSVEAAE